MDATFASCTNLNSFNVLGKAERALGVPCVSSNSALLWHLLREGGAGPESTAVLSGGVNGDGTGVGVEAGLGRLYSV